MKFADIRKIFPDMTTEQQKQLMDLVHEDVDPLRDEIDNLRRQVDAGKNNESAEVKKWKDKYDAEHSAFESFKSDQTKKETRAAKEKALKDILVDAGLSDKGQAKALKYADFDSIELTDDGKIKDASKVRKAMAEEWSDFVTSTDDRGHTTTEPDGKGVARTPGGKTKEEILKIADTAERQKAIAENLSLFQH